MGPETVAIQTEISVFESSNLPVLSKRSNTSVKTQKTLKGSQLKIRRVISIFYRTISWLVPDKEYNRDGK